MPYWNPKTCVSHIYSKLSSAFFPWHHDIVTAFAHAIVLVAL